VGEDEDQEVGAILTERVVLLAVTHMKTYSRYQLQTRGLTAQVLGTS